VLTYDVLFEGQESTERRRNYFVNILDRSLQPLLKTSKVAR